MRWLIWMLIAFTIDAAGIAVTVDRSLAESQAASAPIAAPEVPPSSQAPSTAGPSAPAQIAAAPPLQGATLDLGEAQEILGKDVHSAADEDMGHIINVIVDSKGKVRAAIIDFGGFLGVGSRKIAVDWTSLHFPPADKPGPVLLAFTRDELKSAPEYKDGKPVTVVGVAPPVAAPAPPPEQPTGSPSASAPASEAPAAH